MAEIYRVCGDANEREVVIMKGTQLGISELLVRLMIFFALRESLTAMLVFPAEKQLRDFRNTRVRPIIEHSSLRGALGGIDNSGLMKVGESFCYLRAALSTNNMISVDADLLFLDEYDRLSPRNVAEVERRIGASNLGVIRRVGVPSEPGYGIAALYERSDQRQWWVTCSNCSEAQLLDFEANVRWKVEDDQIVEPKIVCTSCGGHLDVRNGDWRARYPERKVPGFHVHRLLDPSADLHKLIEEKVSRELYRQKAFVNNDLGLPYADEGRGLFRTSVAAAVSAATTRNGGVPLQMASFYDGFNMVTAGIDVASVRSFHVRISELLDSSAVLAGCKRALFIGTVETREEVVALLRRFRVNFACIDAAPEYHDARWIANELPGQVYLIRYVNQQERVHVDRETQSIKANRTLLLDLMVDQFIAQRNLLPEDLPPGYIEQMTTPRRAIVDDHLGSPAARWDKNGQADDCFHAEAYDLAAADAAEFGFVFDELKRKRSELFTMRDLIDPETLSFSPHTPRWLLEGPDVLGSNDPLVDPDMYDDFGWF